MRLEGPRILANPIAEVLLNGIEGPNISCNERTGHRMYNRVGIAICGILRGIVLPMTQEVQSALVSEPMTDNRLELQVVGFN